MWIYYKFIVKEIWFVTKLNATLYDDRVHRGCVHWFPTDTLSDDVVNWGGVYWLPIDTLSDDGVNWGGVCTDSQLISIQIW